MLQGETKKWKFEIYMNDNNDFLADEEASKFC